MSDKPTTKIVHILHNPGQLLEVDNPAVEISRSNGDQVKWVSNSSSFKVKFKGKSPFGKGNFDKKHSSSGPAPKKTPLKRYRYRVDVGGDVLDPEVVVRG